MKTLYIDCGMGAAGDMLSAALLELFEDREAVVQELNSLGIPGVEYRIEKTAKCGIIGTKMHVLVNGEEEGAHTHEHHDHDHEHHHDHEEGHEHSHHHHSGLHDIEHIVYDHLSADDRIRDDIMNVYRLIADAESQVHDMPVDQIHFHEVGSMDAIADVAAVAYLLNRLQADRIIASAVHVGRGTVKCAHGILPVPAPATALLLKGIPFYSREEISGELCTPTGAALLKYYVNEFKVQPVMSVDRIGYGMGTRDFPIANCVRVLFGSEEKAGDVISELSFNVDDMTGEEIGFATERLLEGGARDVFTTSISMKKNRPGTLISVICTPDLKEKMAELIFRHTSTLGIRETLHNRYVLERKIVEEETDFGRIRRKESSGYGVRKVKYEYDDLERLARENDCSLETIKEKLGI